jgi:hypothetical protein
MKGLAQSLSNLSVSCVCVGRSKRNRIGLYAVKVVAAIIIYYDVQFSHRINHNIMVVFSIDRRSVVSWTRGLTVN